MPINQNVYPLILKGYTIPTALDLNMFNCKSRSSAAEPISQTILPSYHPYQEKMAISSITEILTFMGCILSKQENYMAVVSHYPNALLKIYSKWNVMFFWKNKKRCLQPFNLLAKLVIKAYPLSPIVQNSTLCNRLQSEHLDTAFKLFVNQSFYYCFLLGSELSIFMTY